MQFEAKIEQMNSLLNKMKNEALAIWGAGIHTSQLMIYTELINLNIAFYIDKNEMRNVNSIYGKPLVSPQKAKFEEVDHIIISSYRNQKEILNEIKAMGYVDKAICLYNENDEGEFYHLIPRKGFYLSGNYNNWKDAEDQSTGYSEQSILDKVLESTIKVMENRACFERDSVVFDYPDYNFRLLAMLGLLFNRHDKINILDFGGALGSEYWKNRKMIYQYNKSFTWNVVEQSNYVCVGNEKIRNNELAFYNSVEDFTEPIQLVLLSGVLQYIDDYQNILKAIISKQPEYIMIDRQAVMDNESRICIEYVTEEIYKASYPIRIISEKELLNVLDSEYELVISNYSQVEYGSYYVDGKEYRCKDILFKRKTL